MFDDRQPGRYPGGKSGAGVYQTIINQIPPHRVYIEPFVGGGGVLRRLRRASRTIACDLDPRVAQRWRAVDWVDFHQMDGVEFLATYDWRGDEMVYLDPPYLMGTRRIQRDLYAFEMEDSDHQRLLDVVARIPAPVILSGYQNDLYDAALPDWRKHTFFAMTRGGTRAEETLWINFDVPEALHDYRYLGDDYRQRERIKAKMTRWAERLERMPLLERQGLLWALRQFQGNRPLTMLGCAPARPVEFEGEALNSDCDDDQPGGGDNAPTVQEPD